MVDFCLQVGENVNTLEVILLLYSISSVLQWCFFIVLAIIIAKYIKKENAIIPDKKKHSHKHYWKGR